MSGIDAVLDAQKGYFDMSIDASGDITTDDFFDTSILYSLNGEKRAAPEEVVEASRRRGWIGSVYADYENGSKLWLYEQSRKTPATLNAIRDEAQKALQWLVSDGYAVAIDDITATATVDGVKLSLTIRRSADKVDRRYYEFWNNSGVTEL